MPFELIFRPSDSKHDRLSAIIDPVKNQNFFFFFDGITFFFEDRGNALISLSVLRLYDMYFYYLNTFLWLLKSLYILISEKSYIQKNSEKSYKWYPLMVHAKLCIFFLGHANECSKGTL